MNQPCEATSDCPVKAFDLKEAKNNAASATSAVVVNSPSTVSFSITWRTFTNQSIMARSIGETSAAELT
jgi:hypothetical protein